MKKKITRVRVVKTYDYGYDPVDYSIQIPYDIIHPEPFNTFILLHETGHAYHKHPVLDGFEMTVAYLFGRVPTYLIQREEEAWEYARQCVKEKYHRVFDEYAKLSVGTYRRTHSSQDTRDYINNYLAERRNCGI